MPAIPLDRGELREALADAVLGAAALVSQALDPAKPLDLEDLATRLLASARIALTARQVPDVDAPLIAAIDWWLETEDPPPAPAAAPMPAAPRPAPTHRWQLTHDAMEMRLLDERRVVVGRVQSWTCTLDPRASPRWSPAVIEGTKVRTLPSVDSFDAACAAVEERLGATAERWTVVETAKSTEAA